MDKKYYLTRRESEIKDYLEKFEFDLISNRSLAPIIKSKSNQNQILSRLSKKGVLIRIHKDLYCLQDQDLTKIATKIHPGYLCLDSALQSQGLLDYENFVIKVATKDIRAKYKAGRYIIQYIPFRELFFGFVEKNGTYISTIEKTIIDCISFSRYISYQIILKALRDINVKQVNWSYFEELILKMSDSNKQRIGYIFDLVSEDNKIPKETIQKLNKHKKSKIRLISNLLHTGKYNKKWMVTDNAELYRYFE